MRRLYMVKSEQSPTQEAPETVLQEAQRLVYGDRNKDYGSPLSDYEKVAKLWSVVLKMEVTPLQAALCMCCIKISREINKHKRGQLNGFGWVCCRSQLDC